MLLCYIFLVQVNKKSYTHSSTPCSVPLKTVLGDGLRLVRAYPAVRASVCTRPCTPLSAGISDASNLLLLQSAPMNNLACSNISFFTFVSTLWRTDS